jgi:ribosomal protein S18 acetylase RimI-like enzyme
MYVQPAHQHKGIGKILLEKSIALAQNCHYKFVRLDTLNYMTPAINLYKKYGFYEIAPYYHNPVATAVYFEKKL